MKLKDCPHLVSVLEVLKSNHPLTKPLRVRVVPMKDHGSCTLGGNEKLFTIHIREKDLSEVKVDTLLHEYAHALEMDINKIHSKMWGELHAQLFTTWVENFA